MNIDQAAREKLLEALRVGMPLRVAADYIEKEYSVVKREMSRDREFRRAVRKAYAQCMRGRLDSLQELHNWQALAFILESLWPHRFGRGRRHMPRAARAARPPGNPDFSRLTDNELQQLDDLLAKLDAQEPNVANQTDAGGGQREGRAEPSPIHPPGVASPGTGKEVHQGPSH